MERVIEKVAFHESHFRRAPPANPRAVISGARRPPTRARSFSARAARQPARGALHHE